MKCTYCNADIPLGGRFCSACGRVRPAAHCDFIEIEAQYSDLRERWRKGELDDDAFDAALQKLIYTDSTGDYWMVGRKSGEWHRYDGEEWVRGDPPLVEELQPAAAVKSEPGGAEPAVTTPVESNAKPAAPLPVDGTSKSAGSPKGILIIAGILLTGWILIATLAAIFRQPLTNTAVNIALTQDWGEIITPETATVQSAAPAKTKVAAPLPTLPAPTAQKPAPPTQTTAYPLIPGWKYVDCITEGVQIAIPAGFTATTTERKNCFIEGSEPWVGLIVMSVEAAHGGTLESEWDWWIYDYNSDLECSTPSYRRSPIGPVTWTTCISAEGSTDFTAIAGPVADGRIIQYYGIMPIENPPGEDFRATYLEMVKSTKPLY
mgnify:CR=1 FL=1